MARQKVYTDHVFTTENAAWKYVTDNYSVEKNYIMKNAKKAGKKVSVGVEKRKEKSYIIVIYIG
jgi:cobalamin biosynthesis protein CbiD